MMNKNTGSFFLALVSIHGLESSYAFQIHRRSATPSKMFAEIELFHEIDIDLDLAEDCATHFGKYSVEEIEHCRDELHARRVQNVAFGEEMSPDIIKERFLEDELILQLNQLEKEMPESYMFPHEETFDSDIDIDGLLMNNGLKAIDLPPHQDAKPSSNNFVLWKELVGEGALESLVICAFLGLVMVAPRFV